LIFALLLADLPQGGLALKLPVGQSVSYRESFSIAEKGSERDLGARATRTVTFKFGEIKRNQSTVSFSYADWTLAPEGTNEDSAQLGKDLRSALDRSAGTFLMNERGQVALASFPEGTRPFLGLVIPPKRDVLPDQWGEKLIPPFGVERPIDFKYRFEGLSSQDTNPVYRISVRASQTDKTVKFNLSGDVFVSPDGTVLRSVIDSRLEEGSMVTSLAYRAEKL
jgi:hypothetical protein